MATASGWKESCKNAVLKIYTNKEGVPKEQICGKNPEKGLTIVSDRDFMRLRLDFVNVTSPITACTSMKLGYFRHFVVANFSERVLV